MRLALLAFLLAATTGVLLRFGLVWGMPAWAQNWEAVRHAHSHLMYFGWATLAIMAMIWHLLPRWTQQPLPRGTLWQMRLTAVAAFLSFPAFWSNGYGTTTIGSAELPLGALVSGWNGIMWIVFAVLYARATAHLVTRPLPIQLWDWAIFLLLAAWSGALGLVILVVLDIHDIFLQQAMLHLFLELFATGWFSLALLGLLWAWLGQADALPAHKLPTQSLALCLAPTFFLGMAPTLVPAHIFWIAALANLGATLLLGRHVVALWQRRAALPPLARFALAAFALHLLIALPLLWPGLWRWSALTQLRVFYLHNLLLGWVSSALLGLGIGLWFPLRLPEMRLLRGVWMGGIGAMLLALLSLGLITRVALLPATFWLQLAAWSSGLILVGISWLVGRAFLATKNSAAENSAAENVAADRHRADHLRADHP